MSLLFAVVIISVVDINGLYYYDLKGQGRSPGTHRAGEGGEAQKEGLATQAPGPGSVPGVGGGSGETRVSHQAQPHPGFYLRFPQPYPQPPSVPPSQPWQEAL